MLALIAAPSIAADQNASVDTVYFDIYADGRPLYASSPISRREPLRAL